MEPMNRLENDIDVAKMVQFLKSLSAKLTPREQFVLLRRLGRNKEPLSDIAAYMNQTEEEVRQIEAKAIRKLQHFNPLIHAVILEMLKDGDDQSMPADSNSLWEETVMKIASSSQSGSATEDGPLDEHDPVSTASVPITVEFPNSETMLLVLAHGLTSPHKPVRSYAIQELENVCNSAKLGTPSLIKRLKDKDRGVQLASRDCLYVIARVIFGRDNHSIEERKYCLDPGELFQLIDKGRKRGYLSYNQLNDSLPDVILPSEIDDLTKLLIMLGIDLKDL